ncbi:MAG: efflux RND transporter permease subunit [Kiritimatiellia bacterium]
MESDPEARQPCPCVPPRGRGRRSANWRTSRWPTARRRSRTNGGGGAPWCRSTCAAATPAASCARRWTAGEAELKLPEGSTLEWGGQFENLQRAEEKLMVVVPVTFGLILVMLLLATGSFRDVVLIATGIPLGLVGGVAALHLRGMPFTVSAAVGFIALSGVAILNGLVLVSFIRQRMDEGPRPPAGRPRGLPGAPSAPSS